MPFYESSDDVRVKAPQHFPGRRARLDEFHARRVLLMVGAFGTPEEGAMAEFATRAGADEFAQGDLFVQHGVVQRWYIREWNEMYT